MQCPIKPQSTCLLCSQTLQQIRTKDDFTWQFFRKARNQLFQVLHLLQSHPVERMVKCQNRNESLLPTHKFQVEANGGQEIGSVVLVLPA
jgi:hypothetical protein